MSEQALRVVAEALETELATLITADDPAYARLADAMRYSALGGGKRLRGWLVVATGDLFNVSRQASLRVGAAIELVHAYSLIHDDLPAMDDADTRRGKPANHKAFDEAIAVLAGDALQALAFEAIASDDWPTTPAIRVQLIAELAIAAGLRGMCGGQMIDLAAETCDLDLAQIIQLQSLKTGALFGFACRAGAILGEGSQDQLQNLDRYAAALGLAFQIQDDLLDLTGDATAVGKDLGRDAERGKATFPGLLGIDGARQRLADLRSEATQSLNAFGPLAEPLVGMLDFVIERHS